jgi:hypothetical protein
MIVTVSRGVAGMDARTLDRLKELGQGQLAPEDVVLLYRRAFREFGALALWSRRPSERPTIAQALTVADCLRNEGNLRSRALAVEIEGACRAAL